MELKNTRKKHNLTQTQVAKYIQTSQQTYSDYENEKTQPTIETLVKLAKLYNTSIDALIGRETNNEIDLSTLGNKKIEFIKELVNVPDNLINELRAYLKGMLYAEQEKQNIIDKVRGNK